MHHAHPMHRIRRRIVSIGLAVALSAGLVVALSSLAVAGPTRDQAPPRPTAAVAAGPIAGTPAGAHDPAPAFGVIPDGPMTGPPARISGSSSESGPGNGRPEVAVPDVAPRVVPRASPGSRVVVLGDSYTTGWNGAGLRTANWTRIVGSARSWKVTNLAVAGTGFMNPGWTGQRVATLVPAALAQHPDVVILASGHNDSSWSALTTSREAERVIDRLRAGLPGAIIVVIGPIWQDGSPPTRCLILRDHLRRKAAAIGAIFIDPLADRWFAAANHRFIGPDGLHPTDAGHRHIAAEVLADLADRLAT